MRFHIISSNYNPKSKTSYLASFKASGPNKCNYSFTSDFAKRLLINEDRVPVIKRHLSHYKIAVVPEEVLK